MDALVDLHCHTRCSDGTVTPTRLVELAGEAQLRAVAVTDHDTVHGVEEALAAGQSVGVEVVPGIEISAHEPRLGDVHILGLALDHRDPRLLARLEEQRRGRDVRNAAMIVRFGELGISITEAELREVAGDAVIGRPHFARLLMKKGITGSMREGFARFLANGRPAHVEREPLPARTAVQWIHEAGGAAIAAHPMTYSVRTSIGLDEVLERLHRCGVDGFEAYHFDAKRKMAKRIRRFARQTGSIVTGGSDFHGENTPGVFVGRGRGHMRVPYEILEGVRAVAASHRTEAQA